MAETNYFRLVSLALLAALYFYGFSGSDSEKSRRTPTPVSQPLLSLCSRDKPNVISFAFTEGVTGAGALMAQTLKSYTGNPTAIFFYIDKDFYFQTDNGYSAQLVENGHIVGLRWYQSWTDTAKLSKSAFQQAIIASSEKINNQINQYITPSKAGKYYPKYIAFDYADSSKKSLLQQYSGYAGELGMYTVLSDFMPESNNENYEAVKLNYKAKFDKDVGTLGTFAIAMHPGNPQASVSGSNILDLINTTIAPAGKTIISISNCLSAATLYRTGISYLFRQCITSRN
eukprot:NODE_113_length_18482_cov_1.630746.p9 type:complete len:286 gc:universal NODE_113_length_18482_cov_1.630746:6106-6963(+)